MIKSISATWIGAADKISDTIPTKGSEEEPTRSTYLRVSDVVVVRRRREGPARRGVPAVAHARENAADLCTHTLAVRGRSDRTQPRHTLAAVRHTTSTTRVLDSRL
ncbi:hypothetical protein ACJJTC_010792 [Scirpophaga incertulas]